jgi:biopolymer transport protein ExbD
MNPTSFAQSGRNSPLDSLQSLKAGGEISKKKRSELALVLPLTSLIDAFSIIVIYLLIGTQTGAAEVQVGGQIQLPVAESGTGIETPAPIVRIEKGQYFINDELVPSSRLGEKLVELKKEDSEILIQADQAMNYADLDPLLRAGSEAGIQKLKFAVVPSK